MVNHERSKVRKKQNVGTSLMKYNRLCHNKNGIEKLLLLLIEAFLVLD